MSNSLVTNFTVGPSKLYHGVEDFFVEQLRTGLGELSHRSPEMTELSKNTLTAFRDYFEIPDDYRVFYTYSATEGMEIFVRAGGEKKICHIVNGNFGNVWAKQSARALKNVQKIENEDGNRVELNDISPDSDADFLAITANETATGIAYSPEEILEIRSKNPNILLGVDVTSSMGMVKYDFTAADGWFFSVQKGFGLPAGLGMVVVSPRLFETCQKREAEGKDVGCHHSLTSLEKKMEGKFQTPTTPNVLNIAAVGFVSRELKKRFGNIGDQYEETKQKAAKLYEFFDGRKDLVPAVSSGRSETTIVVNGLEEDLKSLHQKLAESGIVVGKGYGPMKTKQVRIANFAVSNMDDIEHLLESIERESTK